RDIKANKIGTNDQPFCIGGNAGNFNRWFDGMIDEVIVYNRALTEAEKTGLRLPLYIFSANSTLKGLA
ncbi:MAG: LamG-like jellyroll fold domain-containing protein, partial [Candidatus Poribacteria bacterium]